MSRYNLSMSTADFPRVAQRYQSLPQACYCQVTPTPLPNPYWVAQNLALAQELAISPSQLEQNLLLFSGSAFSLDPPILAACYAGHQFGHYVPQLGDGRAMLLGDVAWQGQRAEVQLKGAGLTPFSRMGDGRAVLRSSIREYLCSEAMAGLGVPTTRALCLTGSAQPVWREAQETAAVLTRVAPSFIRFGSFEYLYHQGLHPDLQALADFVLQHHYPECRLAEHPYVALFSQISQATAHLLAHWQAVGFCHGVMNSDNMSILGLTLDYGPFGFLDHFDARHRCNHSDSAGRYAYQQQPQAAHWNLYCLANAFLPLIPKPVLLEILEAFPLEFEQARLQHMRAKLGLLQPQEDDKTLIQALLALLQAHATDYTVFFRRLSRLSLIASESEQAIDALFTSAEDWQVWRTRYQERLHAEASLDEIRQPRMLACNPKYILRNYLAEQAIERARTEHDFSEIQRLHLCLQQPYAEQPEFEAYAALPPTWAREICLSCSS